MTKTKSLSDILTALRMANKTIATRREDVPITLRGGFGIQQASARDQAVALRAEILAATSPGRLLAIFADGDAGKLAEVADLLLKPEPSGIILDAGLGWRQIAADIEPSFGDARKFGVAQHSLMIQGFAELARAADFNMATPPSYAEAVCRTPEETVALVRSRCRATMGDEMTIRRLKTAIIDAVVAGELTAAKLPVVVIGAAQEEQSALQSLFSRVTTFTVPADFVVTKEEVQKAFSK